MKFGLSSYVVVSPYTDNSTAILEKTRKMGFDLLEVSVETVGSFDPYKLKDDATANDLGITICGAFGPTRDIGSEDSSIRKSAYDYLTTCIDYAAIVGSSYVAGPMYATSGVTGNFSRAQYLRLVEGLKNVADYAEKKNVQLAVEPLNRFETDVINTVDQGLKLIDDIGSEKVGFLLDAFHMNIEEKSLPGAIRKACDRVFDFHACANDRGTPGEDHIDWLGIKAALEDVGYKGPMVIESFQSGVKEIAKSTSLWRPVAESMDALATNGLAFLKGLYK